GHSVAGVANLGLFHEEFVRTIFVPEGAVAGFLFGALVGGGIGALWKRRRLDHAAACVLITCLGGWAGAVAGAWLGGGHRVMVVGNAVHAEHGPSSEVVLASTLLGLALGALVAWGLSRLPGPGLNLPAASPTRSSGPLKPARTVGYVLVGTGIIALVLFMVL